MKNTLFSKLLIILTSVCVLSSCNKKKVLDDLMERDIYNGEITVNGQKCSFFLEMPIFSPLTNPVYSNNNGESVLEFRMYARDSNNSGKCSLNAMLICSGIPEKGVKYPISVGKKETLKPETGNKVCVQFMWAPLAQDMDIESHDNERVIMNLTSIKDGCGF